METETKSDMPSGAVDQQRRVRRLAEALQDILDNAHLTLNESAREKWERGEFNINTLRPEAEAALREYQANETAMGREDES